MDNVIYLRQQNTEITRLGQFEFEINHLKQRKTVLRYLPGEDGRWEVVPPGFDRALAIHTDQMVSVVRGHCGIGNDIDYIFAHIMRMIFETDVEYVGQEAPFEYDEDEDEEVVTEQDGGGENLAVDTTDGDFR